MKKVIRDITLVSPIDWARLAAFIDGEGCVSLKGRRQRDGERVDPMFLKLHVTNTDPRLHQWLLETFGGAVTVHRSGGRYKDRFDWVVVSHDAAALLRNCLPFLLLKRDRAELALAFQATVQKRGARPGHPRRGNCALPGDVVEARAEMKTQMHELNKKGQ